MSRAATGTSALRVALLLVVALLAGCVKDPSQAPLLGNPKLLLDRTEDNLTRVYLHSAFGERAYARLTVRLDNATVAESNDTYALVHKTASTAFALSVEARSPLANYTTTVLVRVLDEGADVAVFDGEDYEEFREVGLPWQKVVEEERRRPEEGAR